MVKDVITKVASLALALGIVGGAIWIMSMPAKVLDSGNSAENSVDINQTAVTTSDKKNRSYIGSMQAESTTNQPIGIVKCQSGGKTTYSDKKCAGIEHQTSVVIKETSGGFVSPDAQTIADTRAQIRAEIRQPGFVAMAGESTPAMTSNTQGQCYYLNEEIKSIDSASNIGQSGWSQDQLRLRRLDVRNRMYRLGC